MTSFETADKMVQMLNVPSDVKVSFGTSPEYQFIVRVDLPKRLQDHVRSYCACEIGMNTAPRHLWTALKSVLKNLK